MNIPDFKKYGFLKYLEFNTKKDRFSHINIEHKVKTSIETEISDLFNKRVSIIIENAQDKQLQELKYLHDTQKVHPLTSFKVSSTLSLDDIAEISLNQLKQLTAPSFTFRELLVLLIKKLKRRINLWQTHF